MDTVSAARASHTKIVLLVLHKSNKILRAEVGTRENQRWIDPPERADALTRLWNRRSHFSFQFSWPGPIWANAALKIFCSPTSVTSINVHSRKRQAKRKKSNPKKKKQYIQRCLWFCETKPQDTHIFFRFCLGFLCFRIFHNQ